MSDDKRRGPSRSSGKSSKYRGKSADGDRATRGRISDDNPVGGSRPPERERPQRHGDASRSHRIAGKRSSRGERFGEQAARGPRRSKSNDRRGAGAAPGEPTDRPHWQKSSAEVERSGGERGTLGAGRRTAGNRRDFGGEPRGIGRQSSKDVSVHDQRRDEARRDRRSQSQFADRERGPRDRSAGGSPFSKGPRRESARDEHRESRDGALWIYGRHAAIAAILNPARSVKRILASESAMEQLNEAAVPAEKRAVIASVAPFEIDRLLHDGAVHQGFAVEALPLPRARLRETCAVDQTRRPVVVLDQITDPHNIGAIFRSAAAFGAKAVIVQDRRTPPLAGALAKAAAGAVDIVPAIEVVNIARALEGLKELGYFCAGLAGEGGAVISAIPRDRPIALVLGAEGAGLRRLVAETCDGLFRIPLNPAMDSLNVSNAAAVALYACAPMERTPAE